MTDQISFATKISFIMLTFSYLDIIWPKKNQRKHLKVPGNLVLNRYIVVIKHS